jgi:hypothetical protein
VYASYQSFIERGKDMNKLLVKKIISLVLASMLLAVVPTTSFGQAATKNLASTKGVAPDVPIEACSSSIAYEPLVNLVTNIAHMGFEVTNISVNEKDNPVIDIYSGKESKIEVKYATNSKIAMTVSEGKTKNELIVKDDGSMIVDGVLVSDDKTSNDLVYMNAFDDSYQSNCPYGTSANYTDYVDTSRDADVGLTTMARNLTTLILAAIIGRFIPGFDLVLGFSMTVAEYIKKYDPLSTAASYVSKQYIHTKGYFVNSTMAVKKLITTIYTRKNYAGKSTVAVYYFIHKLNI